MREFIVKLLNLCIILAVLCGYQTYAKEYQRKEEAYLQEKEKADREWEEEKLKKERVAADKDANSKSLQTQKKEYKDGVYEGKGTGFGGSIVVEIQIYNDEIIDAGITKADNETPDYLAAASVIVEKVVKNKTTDINVDTVSGATLSSNGILEAMEDALKKAKNVN